ncbi:phosducin-like protein isoform X2 [Glandiceps talaboti]
MASLEDKLLGEKTANYCSSSEEDSGDEDGFQKPGTIREASSDYDGYSGTATHTGPKGVIEDWRRFKQLENESNKEQERERLLLSKKLSMTCRTNAKEDDERQMLELEAELEDEFLHRYRLQRMREMQQRLLDKPTYGKVIQLTREKFLDAVDKEKPQVTVVIHIYEQDVRGCDAVNGCMQCLAVEYPSVKFCAIKSSETPLSGKFTAQGLPALLVYKQGTLIANFVRISDQLGDDFFAGDLEHFLQDHGLLTSKTERVPGVIRDTCNLDEDDSDLDID